MNIGIITYHRAENYGSVLQAYALNKYIKNINSKFHVETIDYYNETQEKMYNLFQSNSSIMNIIRNIHTLLNIKALKNKKKAFKKFISIHISLSETIGNDTNKLKQYAQKYDICICGSDQIWNPDYNIPAFFLNFGRKDCRKIIYAASIGKGQLSGLERKTYSKLLEFPDYISVREDSAQKLISSITEKNVELVLDPTLLHQQEYWMKKADDSSLNHRNYIFCYFLNLTDEKVKSANDFARKNNCEIIAIPYLHNEVEEYTEKLEGKILSEVNPADFLNLIRNAEAIITDSFHATVFSIIFKKNFWCFGRNVGTYNMNTRLHTLLGYVEMQDRLIEPNDLKNKMHCTHVDIDLHNLKMKQNESIAFLSNALEIS